MYRSWKRSYVCSELAGTHLLVLSVPRLSRAVLVLLAGCCHTRREIAMNATVVDAIAAPSSVSVWPRYPTVYEINTWVWLSELSQKYGKAVDLV